MTRDEKISRLRKYCTRFKECEGCLIKNLCPEDGIEVTSDKELEALLYVIGEKPKENKRTEILEKAKEIINGQREEDYGSPIANFNTIAGMWTHYLNTEIYAEDVCAMMAMLKFARVRNGNGTEDCWIDAAGYAALAAEVER